MIHDPQNILFAWGVDESESEYSDQTLAQKLCQELRCSFINNAQYFEADYLTRLPVRDRVLLAGVETDICIEYVEGIGITLPEEAILETGSFEKSSIMDFNKWHEVPKLFTYKYTFGGLTIYTNTDNFYSYINPNEVRIKSDFESLWTQINLSDGLQPEEFKLLKSIAACATMYLSAQERYDLITAIAKNNIPETEEDLILDILETSAFSSEFELFMTKISGDIPLFKSLYDKMHNFGGNEENKDRFINTMYDLWNVSEYKLPQNELYTYNQTDHPPVLCYDPKGTFIRSFGIEGYSFRIIDDLKVDYYVDDEGYINYSYHPFQPIRLLFSEGETDINFPSQDIPVFMLMGVEDVANCKARLTTLNVTFDVATVFIGLGGLTTLKNLHGAYKVSKAIIAGTEITASATDAVLNYTDACNGSEAFCNELKKYTFWMQLASLGGDVLVSKMARRSAKNVLDNIENSGMNSVEKAEFKKYLEDIVGVANNGTGNIDDLLARLDDNQSKDIFKENFEKFTEENKNKFFENNALVDSWKVLYENKSSSFIKTDVARLEVFHKFTLENQQLIRQFTDLDANSTLAKFLDDCDDDFINYLNDNSEFVEGIISHKTGSNLSELDLQAQYDLLGEEIRGTRVPDAQKVNLQKWLDRSSELSSFGKYTQKGIDLSNNITDALKARSTQLFEDLAEKIEIEPEVLAGYDIYNEVPLYTEGGFMKADIVFVKVNEATDVVEDVIIIENKLSVGTDYTVRQKEGWKKLSNGENLEVKYSIEGIDASGNSVILQSGESFGADKIRAYKINDHGTIDITTISSSDISPIPIDNYKNYTYKSRE